MSMKPNGAANAVTSCFVNVSFIASSTTTNITYKPSTTGENASRETKLLIVHTITNNDPTGWFQP